MEDMSHLVRASAWNAERTWAVKGVARECLDGRRARLTSSWGSEERLYNWSGSAGQVIYFQSPRRIIIIGAIVPSPQYSANTVSEPPTVLVRWGSKELPSIGRPGQSLVPTRSTSVGRMSSVETLDETRCGVKVAGWWISRGTRTEASK